jgi:uncharacterized Zn finger protein (UPF0148 family)
MFEKLLSELGKLDGMKISIPIKPDEEGFIDKECPDEECKFQFKVHEKDWTNIFKDESVFCPMCGKESTSDNFWTAEQIRNAEGQASQLLESKIHKAMKEDANTFNRSQPKGGFLSMSMRVKGNVYEKIILPIPSKDIFEQKIKCEKCESRYSVIGSAFFCPACGHNSVEKTFSAAINKIESTINNIPTIRTALNSISKDQAEITCQTIIEKGLLDCVVAFQRFCDMMYKKHIEAKPKILFNSFQKLDVGGDLWYELFNESYVNWLSKSQYERLNMLFQRRHLLQHTDGIIDQKYLDKSGDDKYNIGQRVIVKERDVLELVGYIKLLSDKIRIKIEAT